MKKKKHPITNPTDGNHIIRRMPPLRHAHEWAPKFYISWSEPVQFCLYATNGKTYNREDWCRAKRLYDEACKSRHFIFDRETRLWRGADYRRETLPSKIQKWVRKIKAHTQSKKRKNSK